MLADVTRRSLLQNLSPLAVLGWAAKPAAAQTEVPSSAVRAQAWRVMSRLGYGPDPAQMAAMTSASSVQDWVQQQVELAHTASQHPPRIAQELDALRASLPELFAAGKVEQALRLKIKDKEAAPDLPVTEAASEALRRMDFSGPRLAEQFTLRLAQQTAAWRLASCSLPELEHPLLARMTEFWFNHLNVFIGKGAVRPFVGHYLLHVIRAHALGKFEELLLTSARHPAMLLYLDQAQSVAEGSKGMQGQARGLNENYARELMELHTLGVNGGYSQTDVRELARVLTGWTIGPQQSSGFRFAPRFHDSGSKQLLGQVFPVSASMAGEQEGIDAIRMLARHPATARRICLRLAQFFVADEPAVALVQQLSQVFLGTQGDMRAVLHALFGAADFWDTQHRLFKTPFDFACSALTVTRSAAGPDKRALVLAMGFLANSGQALHGWQTPDGYKTDAATWLAPEALTRRADFALALTQKSAGLALLDVFLRPDTRSAIASEPLSLHAGLALASPDFMYK